MIDSIIDSMTYKFSQVGRVETYYIKPNPPLFFRQQNMLRSSPMLDKTCF